MVFTWQIYDYKVNLASRKNFTYISIEMSKLSSSLDYNIDMILTHCCVDS